MNETEKKFVRKEIQQLISTGCIVPLKRKHNGWVSNIFLRPKKDGSFRLILNLKPLNKFIEYRKFKMPSIRTVTQMIKQDDQLVSVNLLDIYSHAKIQWRNCPKLQFKFENKFYMYKVLPNGIAVDLRFFIEMTKSIASFLCQKGIQIVIYIDDTLIVAANRA